LFLRPACDGVRRGQRHKILRKIQMIWRDEDNARTIVAGDEVELARAGLPTKGHQRVSADSAQITTGGATNQFCTFSAGTDARLITTLPGSEGLSRVVCRCPLCGSAATGDFDVSG
jgi:hypothetical protein